MDASQQAVEVQYAKVCGPKLDEISCKINEIHRAVFVGNGSGSLTLKIDRNTRALRWLASIFALLVAPIIVGACIILVEHFVSG